MAEKPRRTLVNVAPAIPTAWLTWYSGLYVITGVYVWPQVMTMRLFLNNQTDESA